MLLLLLLGLLGLSRLTKIQNQLQNTEAKLDAMLKHLGVDWAQFSEPSDQVKALAQDPITFIQAIKAYREQTGLGLKEAKDVVERLARPKAESH